MKFATAPFLLQIILLKAETKPIFIITRLEKISQEVLDFIFTQNLYLQKIYAKTLQEYFMLPVFFQAEVRAIFILYLKRLEKYFLAFKISQLLPFQMFSQYFYQRKVTLLKAFYKLLLREPIGLLNTSKFFQLPFLEICNVLFLRLFLHGPHQKVEVNFQYQLLLYLDHFLKFLIQRC